MPFAFPTIALLSLLCIAISIPVHAYIDPGTGSLIIQSIIGAIAAIGVTMKLYWHRLKIFFSGNSKPSQTEEKPSDKTSE